MANISCVCQTETQFSIEHNVDKLTIKLQIYRKGQFTSIPWTQRYTFMGKLSNIKSKGTKTNSS